MSVTVTVLPLLDLPPATAFALWRLRQDVFVVEQACAYPDLDDRDTEPATRHVLLTEPGTGEVVGCARVLDDGPVWRVGRVALARSHRGHGLADVLVRAALERCPGRDVVIGAQAPLAGWYGAFGFVPDGEPYDEDGIPHLPMRLPLAARA